MNNYNHFMCILQPIILWWFYIWLINSHIYVLLPCLKLIKTYAILNKSGDTKALAHFSLLKSLTLFPILSILVFPKVLILDCLGIYFAVYFPPLLALKKQANKKHYINYSLLYLRYFIEFSWIYFCPCWSFSKRVSVW